VRGIAVFLVLLLVFVVALSQNDSPSSSHKPRPQQRVTPAAPAQSSTVPGTSTSARRVLSAIAGPTTTTRDWVGPVDGWYAPRDPDRRSLPAHQASVQTDSNNLAPYTRAPSGGSAWAPGQTRPSTQSSGQSTLATRNGSQSATLTPPPPRVSPSRVAENGSYYGQISEKTGRPKTVHVRGYYRKDGTYVRGHYRSRPRH